MTARGRKQNHTCMLPHDRQQTSYSKKKIQILMSSTYFLLAVLLPVYQFHAAIFEVLCGAGQATQRQVALSLPAFCPFVVLLILSVNSQHLSLGHPASSQSPPIQLWSIMYCQQKH